MDPNTFYNISADYLSQALGRLTSKGEEYSLSSNRFEQLERQAELNNCTVEEVIDVLMGKHITMILDTQHTMTREEFNERSLDVICYLCFLNGIYTKAGEM